MGPKAEEKACKINTFSTGTVNNYNVPWCSRSFVGEQGAVKTSNAITSKWKLTSAVVRGSKKKKNQWGHLTVLYHY